MSNYPCDDPTFKFLFENKEEIEFKKSLSELEDKFFFVKNIRQRFKKLG